MIQGDDTVAIVAILSVFVIAPLAIAVARLIWKRASQPPIPRTMSTDVVQQRLEQLQQSVEAMAIEVERVSEGQRFVTKLLSERGREALGSTSDKPAP